MDFKRIVAWTGRHRRWFNAIGLFLLLPIIVWFVGWLTVGDAPVWVRWGAYVMPWLGLAALFTAALFLVGRAFGFMTIALCTGLLVLAPMLPRLMPERLFASHQPGNLRVLTFNIDDGNDDFVDVAKVIVRERPDIAFLQEVKTEAALRALIAANPAGLHYFAYPPTTWDLMILSRYPLDGTIRHSDGSLLRNRVTATVEIAGCRIQLWDMHAPHGQYQNLRQAELFTAAAVDIRDSGARVLMGADLNSTEFNNVQTPLRRQLHDAFADVGAGFGFTFPSPVRRFGMLGRLFRIDHVFYRGLVPFTARVVHDNANSDHFPVLATFQLRPCRRPAGAHP